MDILERKQDYIDKCLSNKNITGINAISYALAIAVGSYKEYKEWISKCAAERELEKQMARNRKDRDISLKGYVPEDTPRKENFFIDFDEDI